MLKLLKMMQYNLLNVLFSVTKKESSTRQCFTTQCVEIALSKLLCLAILFSPVFSQEAGRALLSADAAGSTFANLKERAKQYLDRAEALRQKSKNEYIKA